MARRHNNKKKKKSSAIRIGETATPERRKRLGGVSTEIVDRDASGKAYIKRHRAKLECVLDFYWRTLKIDDPQHAAGMKFREIYLRMNNNIASKALGDIVLVDDGHIHVENRMLEHVMCMRQLDKARTKLSPAQDRIIMRICGYDEYAGTINQKKTLRRALNVLARFWGFIPDNTVNEK